MSFLQKTSKITLILFFITIPFVFIYTKEIIYPHLHYVILLEPPKEALARFFTWILLILFLIQIAFFKKSAIKTSLYIPIILILGLQGLSLFWAHNTVQAIESWIHWICLFIFFVVCLHAFSSLKTLKYLMNTALISASIIGISGILCRLFATDLPFFPKRSVYWWSTTFGNYTFAGEYIAPLIFWAMALYFTSIKHKKYYLFLILLLIFSLLYNFRSRASLLALILLFIPLGAFFLYQKNRFQIFLRVKYLFVFSILFAISLLTIPRLLTFLDIHISHGGNDQRIITWKNTVKMASDHLVKGVGIGNFYLFYPFYQEPRDRIVIPEYHFIRFAHNEYLQTLAELGIGGVILLVICFLLISQSVIKFLKKKDACISAPNDIFNNSEKTFVFFFYMSFLCSSLIAFFGFNFQNPASSYGSMATLAFMMGLMLTSNGHAHIQCTAEESFEIVRKTAFTFIIFAMVILSPFFLFRNVFSDYYRHKGESYAKTHNLKAIEAYQKALKWQNDWEIHFLLSSFYAEQYRYNQAIDHMKKSIELNPSYEVGFYKLGLYYEKIKNMEQAKESYQKLLEFSPHHKKALNRLGNIALTQKKFQEAQYYLKKVFEFPFYQREEDAVAFLGMALLNIHQGQTHRALGKMIEVYNIEPTYIKKVSGLYYLWMEQQ